MNKIPLLGDLPLIGGLFRFEGEDTVNTELIVFITPQIVERSDLTANEAQAYELTRFSAPKPKLTRAEKELEESKTNSPRLMIGFYYRLGAKLDAEAIFFCRLLSPS